VEFEIDDVGKKERLERRKHQRRKRNRERKLRGYRWQMVWKWEGWKGSGCGSEWNWKLMLWGRGKAQKGENATRGQEIERGRWRACPILSFQFVVVGVVCLSIIPSIAVYTGLSGQSIEPINE
jgi:hypothetical protein